jgi:hypothetical protein
MTYFGKEVLNIHTVIIAHAYFTPYAPGIYLQMIRIHLTSLTSVHSLHTGSVPILHMERLSLRFLSFFNNF